MSTAGIYNYHYKVANPNARFPVQMESGEFQKPFYFGGSQVPVNLNIPHGSGIRSHYSSSIDEIKNIGTKSHGMGCGLKTTNKKNDMIRLSKYMFHK